MTAGESAVAGRYADPARDVVAERTPLWHEHGLPGPVALELLEHMPRYAVLVHALPQTVEAIDTGGWLVLGGRRWQPIVGRGHSPEHLSLLSEDGALLLGGDQVLPKITPNIAVWPGGDPDPLRSYLASLEAFAALSGQTLLLPSHKQPLWGIATRVEEIRMHHEDRLNAVLRACGAPMTCYEMLPALFGRRLRQEEIGFGLGEAIAHLNFMQSEGLLVSSLDAQGQRRFARADELPSP
jgi:glyoxylase-like metal-dependent hydrolase (beta-lactamase superfamily II)